MIFRSRPIEIALSAVLVLTCLAGPVMAQPSAEASDGVYERHMSLGIRLYEDRNFEAAMIEFERAYAARHAAGPLIDMALCEKGRLEYVRAARILERARAESSATTEQLAAIDKAASELRELIAVVELRAHVATEGAVVEVDGEALASGAASKPIELSPGRHVLTLRLEGFDAFRTELRVGAGDRSTIDVVLVPNVGNLVIRGTKVSDGVSVDGQPRKKDPSRISLRSGTHLVVLRRGLDRYSLSVAIVASHDTALSLDDAGLLRIDDGPPRGPDRIDLAPLRGIYFRGTGDVGVRVGRASPFFVTGTDVGMGYRIITALGVEAHLRQLFTDGGVSAPNAITQVSAGVRLMTRPSPVAFEMQVGAGVTYEVPLLGESGFAGFLAVASPELSGRVGHAVLGVGTPVTFTDSPYGPNVEVSLRLAAGYAQW